MSRDLFLQGITRSNTLRQMAGDGIALMEGISNTVLLQGTPDEVTAISLAAAAADIDVIGPECAIPLTTPLANLQAMTCIPRERQIV